MSAATPIICLTLTHLPGSFFFEINIFHFFPSAFHISCLLISQRFCFVRDRVQEVSAFLPSFADFHLDRVFLCGKKAENLEKKGRGKEERRKRATKEECFVGDVGISRVCSLQHHIRVHQMNSTAFDWLYLHCFTPACMSETPFQTNKRFRKI